RRRAAARGAPCWPCGAAAGPVRTRGLVRRPRPPLTFAFGERRPFRPLGRRGADPACGASAGNKKGTSVEVPCSHSASAAYRLSHVPPLPEHSDSLLVLKYCT